MIVPRSSGPVFVFMGSPITNIYDRYVILNSSLSLDIGTPVLLGFCERSPVYTSSSYKHHEYNTAYGLDIPFMTPAYGSDIIITLSLTRFNSALINQTLYNWSNFLLSRRRPIQSLFDISGFSNKDLFSLLLYFPLGDDLAHSDFTLFPSCFIETVKFEGFGPVMDKVTLVVRAVSVPLSPTPNIVSEAVHNISVVGALR